MTKSDKKKWLKALRSGKYNQTKKCLKDDGGYCCLGVAREIGLTRKNKKHDDLVSKSFLRLCDQQVLAELNDTGHSFEKIADFIEDNLECTK